MRKQYFGRQFKRDANERKALFKNLLNSLVLEERIITTEAKAKAIRSAADKLVTKAKKPDAFARLAPDVRYVAVAKLVNAIAPRFADRQGGYTRIIKVGRRVADNAPQVVMEWVVKGEKFDAKAAKVKKRASTKAAQKPEKKRTDAVVATKPEKEKKPEKDVKPNTNVAAKKIIRPQKKG